MWFQDLMATLEHLDKCLTTLMAIKDIYALTSSWIEFVSSDKVQSLK